MYSIYIFLSPFPSLYHYQRPAVNAAVSARIHTSFPFGLLIIIMLYYYERAPRSSASLSSGLAILKLKQQLLLYARGDVIGCVTTTSDRTLFPLIYLSITLLIILR